MIDEPNKRRAPFGVRFTEDELAQIRADAREAGISVHALVRLRGAGRRVSAKKAIDTYRARLIGRLQCLAVDECDRELVGKLRDLIIETMDRES